VKVGLRPFGTGEAGEGRPRNVWSQGNLDEAVAREVRDMMPRAGGYEARAG